MTATQPCNGKDNVVGIGICMQQDIHGRCTQPLQAVRCLPQVSGRSCSRQVG